MFTISDFWRRRLSVSSRGINGVLKGWQHIEQGLPTFLEAPLGLATGFGDGVPNESTVILVSAPGAVGKSTLARQIAFETGAMLLDLAQADSVGANTLIGGLARTELYQPFLEGNASLVIDGLDEARMRVTDGSFAAFMNDVPHLAGENRKPLILFGRTGAVQEAWLWLMDRHIDAPVFEIGYYDYGQAAEFAKTQAQNIRKERDRREPDGRAIELILERLRARVGKNADSFAGYSPVLIAVAKRVADPSDPDTRNTQALISRIEQGKEDITLSTITESILCREQEKLKGLDFEDPSLRGTLYSPDEQIARLLMKLYDDKQEPDLPHMSPQDQQTYFNALDTWVAEHPFLDGAGSQPSSAVFGGLLASKALHSESVAGIALYQEFSRGTVNPFLTEFFLSELSSTESPVVVPAKHVGILYSSQRARMSQGQFASLQVDADTIIDGTVLGTAEVHIGRTDQNGDEIEPIRFRTEHAATFQFGARLEDIDIDAPAACVSVGLGANEVKFVAPVSIDVRKIVFDSGNVVVERFSQSRDSDDETDRVVSLRTEALEAAQVSSPPVRHGKVLFEVSGPDFGIYPWREFLVTPPQGPDPRIDEALRRLKRILRLFRARGKQQLAKYRAAIDASRRTKGSGELIRKQLLEEGVLRIDGSWYFLDPDKLADRVGLTFQDVCTTNTTERTTAFLERTLERLG